MTLLVGIGLLCTGCPATEAPTWHQDIAPIVASHCQSCHSPGNIAPFELMTYEDAAPIADWLAAEVESGAMPPWGAQETDECSPPSPFKGDLRLSDEEKELFTAWADAGAPEGDPSTAAPLPEVIDNGLLDATQRLSPQEPFVVSGSGDQFRCFVLDPELSETVYLTGLEVIPDELAVDHHALVWLDSNRQSEALAGSNGQYDCFGSGGVDGPLVGGWVPGAGSIQYPEDSGIDVPPGSLFVMQMHYHGDGGEHSDATSLDIRYTTDEPSLEVLIELEGNEDSASGGLQPGSGDTSGVEFRIPAGATNHVEEIHIELPQNLPSVALWLVGNHMHYVGRDMKTSIERGPGSEEEDACLLQTPSWDFNWQRLYQYQEDDPFNLPRISGGDTLVLRCSYDNSLGNPFLPAALDEVGLTEPIDVGLGGGTLDEMCLAVVGVVYPR